MRVWLLLVIVFFVPFAFSLESNLTIFTFRDITDNSLIDGVGVYISDGIDTSSFFIPDGGVLRVTDKIISPVLYIRADDYSTKGNDYYQILEDYSGRVLNVYLFPVGSIRGIVKDKLDNVVPDAKLKFECGNNDFSFPTETDEFGSFFVDYIPIGECMVYANHGDATGTASVFMSKGNFSDVEIILDKKLINNDNGRGYFVMFAFLAFLVVFIFIIMGRKKKKRISKKESNDSEPEKTSLKIMQTLNDNERSVVEYLLSNNKCAMQNNIRHATHIPRTSLSRVVSSLQRKKIVDTEKYGKSVKLSLTDFFLGKG